MSLLSFCVEQNSDVELFPCAKKIGRKFFFLAGNVTCFLDETQAVLCVLLCTTVCTVNEIKIVIYPVNLCTAF